MSESRSMNDKIKELFIPNAEGKVRNGITTKEKNYIERVLEKFSTPAKLQELLENQNNEFKIMITFLGLCSKFHIVNKIIEQMVLFLICQPTIDLNRLIYKKTFPSYEFMLQQHVLYIKPKIESPEKILGDYRDDEIEVHYLIGSVVGFKIKNGPEWKSGNRIVFSM